MFSDRMRYADRTRERDRRRYRTRSRERRRTRDRDRRSRSPARRGRSSYEGLRGFESTTERRRRRSTTNDDRPRNRPRVRSSSTRFPDQDITPARSHHDDVEEEKRKKRLARFGTLEKPKIKEICGETKEITNKINGKKEALEKERDASRSQDNRDCVEEPGATESSKEEKAEKDNDVGLLDPVKLCAPNVENTVSSSKSDKVEVEEEEEVVGLLVPVEAVSSSEEEDDRNKAEKALEKRKNDRLARFGTLKKPKIEQPFKPKKSAGEGDNTKPLWRDGRVRSRDRDHRESKTHEKEDRGEDIKSKR